MKTVVADLEANGLKPDKIWIVVCIDVDTEERHVFYPYRGEEETSRLRSFAGTVGTWVGHHFLGYDLPVLNRLLQLGIDPTTVVDTLVVSRLLDATRDKHSLEAWGYELGVHKKHTGIEDWSKFTPEMEERCISDALVNLALFKRFSKYIHSPLWADALRTEHFIQDKCTELHENGFAFDFDGAVSLKTQIDVELDGLTGKLQSLFPPRAKLISEVTPRATKFGTLNRTDFRWLGPSPDLSEYSVGAVFSRISFEPFNPASAPQRIDRLWEAGWRPTEKTKGHKEADKELRELNRKRRKTPADHEAIKTLKERLTKFAVYGWTVSEENLDTLPEDAPEGIRTLVRWMKLKNRSSTLQSWMDAYDASTGRIHGSFNSIGAWTHRMSHDRPNMGNVPKFDAKQPDKTPYSDRMRALWTSASDRVLVGVDADSIQLRILAHYIDDEEFTRALVAGKKEDGSDPHSVNQRALGYVCKSRDDAKTFIYAWLLGAGIAKVAEILRCSKEEGQIANDNFLARYPGLRYVKEEVIPKDAERGFFQGFDGRFVRIWGNDFSSKCHFALAGYLQCGEVVIMKRAAELWYPKLKAEKVPFWWVNFVHDEYQIETIRDMEVAKYVATTVADSIRQVGVDLGLRCPLAGSILNGHGKLAIGDTWYETH